MSRNVDVCRLEGRFAAKWAGREDTHCIWWQGHWWPWKWINDLVSDCEDKLKSAGFERGQRIAALLPNSPVTIALAVACWRLGGAFAPLNARTGVENLLSTIEMLDVHAVFVTEDKFLSAAKAAESKGIPVAAAGLDRPIERWRGRRGDPEHEKYAIIFSTSGTSGLPKAVPCSHSNLLSNIDSMTAHVPGLIDYSSVFLNVLPNFHTLGFNIACMLPLLSGIRQAVLPSFVPVDATVDAIKTSGTNCIIAVPTVISFILGALEKTGERLDGIKLVITGGDRLSAETDLRCRRCLGVGILEGYGLTECSPVVAVGHSIETARLGAVGQICDGYDFEIRDMDGNKIDPHDEGVLWVKGPSVVDGYFRDKISTMERFSDGWFNTGDVVKIDGDGYMRIVDRATDIIIVGGFNVYPQEVEAVLSKHPAVLSAVAVGEKNSVTGEIVKAFVIPREGHTVTAKELMVYCKERLAHYKTPRKIAFVSEFPISQSGKILRRELRKIKI
jgi:long-chain acyl-CoA synthetase